MWERGNEKEARIEGREGGREREVRGKKGEGEGGGRVRREREGI